MPLKEASRFIRCAPWRDPTDVSRRALPLLPPEWSHSLIWENLSSSGDEQSTADLIACLPPSTASGDWRITERLVEWATRSEARMALLPRLLGGLPPRSVEEGPPDRRKLATALARTCACISEEASWRRTLLLLEKAPPNGAAAVGLLRNAFRALAPDRRRGHLRRLAALPGGRVGNRHLIFEAACAAEWVEAVDLLLACGSHRPEVVLETIRHNPVATLRAFLNRGALRGSEARWTEEELVCRAVELGTTETLCLVEEHPNGVPKAGPRAVWWLRAAAAYGRVDLLAEVLSRLPEAEQGRALAESDTLHVAVVGGHTAMVRFLVRALEVDVDGECSHPGGRFRGRSYSRTALEEAVRRSQYRAAVILLEAGAAVDERHLHAAVDIGALDLLLRHYPCDRTPPLNALFRTAWDSTQHPAICRYLTSRWPGAFVEPSARWDSVELLGDDYERRWRTRQVADALRSGLLIRWLVDLVSDYLELPR